MECPGSVAATAVTPCQTECGNRCAVSNRQLRQLCFLAAPCPGLGVGPNFGWELVIMKRHPRVTEIAEGDLRKLSPILAACNEGYGALTPVL